MNINEAAVCHLHFNHHKMIQSGTLYSCGYHRKLKKHKTTELQHTAARKSKPFRSIRISALIINKILMSLSHNNKAHNLTKLITLFFSTKSPLYRNKHYLSWTQWVISNGLQAGRSKHVTSPEATWSQLTLDHQRNLCCQNQTEAAHQQQNITTNLKKGGGSIGVWGCFGLQ